MSKQCLVLVFGLLVGRTARAGDLVAVLNPLNPTTELSEKTVRKLFIGTIRYWDGGSVGVVPYLRPESSEAGEALMEICHLDRGRFDALWRKRQLSGIGIPPQELADASDVLDAVAEDPRAIGIITAEEMAAADGSKVRLIPL